MGLEVPIRDQVGLEVDEGVEIGLVIAVVQSVGESNLCFNTPGEKKDRPGRGVSVDVHEHEDQWMSPPPPPLPTTKL